jgi:cytochrome P450
MATHPAWQDALRAEIRQALPSISSGETPTTAMIDDLPLLNAIYNETLRLYPTVPVTVRESIRPTFLGARPIPAGTRVILAPWAINRSEALWGPRAAEFTPERWLAPGCANTGGARSNYSVITFLHGPRSCIGQGFAKAEFKCLLAAVVGRFSWRMARPEEPVYPAGVVTTKPHGGMHLRMEIVEGW